MSLIDDALNGIKSATTTQFDASTFTQPDPRRFVVEHCDSKAEARRMQLERSKRTGFIAGLDKIAGIEGLGVIQEGLSTIVKTTGVGGAEWERIVNGGVEGVLGTVLGEQATNVLTGAMEKINPGAVNKGVSTAKIILDKVKERDFNWRDIPQYVADFKNLWTLGEMVVNPFLGNDSASNTPRVSCSASPYAMDLVAQGVKHKFLFVVEFKFYKEYQNLLNIEPSFTVRTADRPTIQYEYEDLNLYNFKTKVIKRAQFTPVTMTFLDDEQNRAVSFYNSLLRIMSPIANHLTPATFEQTGMEYQDVYAAATGRDSATQGIRVYNHAASIGPLLGQRTSIIESINLYHVYLGGQKVNRYTFHHPRILNLTLDQLDMSNSDIPELKIEFAFDNIEIVNNDAEALPMSRRDREDGSLYPLGGRSTQPGDFSSDQVQNPSSQGTLAGSGTLAELYARGESFIEGAYDTASGWASDAYNSVTGLFGGSGATAYAAPASAPLEVSAVQRQVSSYEKRTQKPQAAGRDLGLNIKTQVLHTK